MQGMGVVPRMLDAVLFWVCENSRFQSIGVRIGVWKWLGACESPYSVEWRRYCERHSMKLNFWNVILKCEKVCKTTTNDSTRQVDSSLSRNHQNRNPFLFLAVKVSSRNGEQS
jgi:hypothetical protein